jgi:hypothetical protein
VETACARVYAVDAIVSCTALHHLPDFWKTMTLHRMNDMLRQDLLKRSGFTIEKSGIEEGVLDAYLCVKE